MADNERIVAFTRIRPFNSAELTQTGRNPVCTHPVVDITSATTITFNPSKLSVLAPVSKYSTARTRIKYDQHYAFDGVFGPETPEHDIYKSVAHPLLEAAVGGTNATIFAYGATGCGKSYTVNMINRNVAESLFELIEPLQTDYDFTVKLSYLQLYNEKIIDLLPDERTNIIEQQRAHKNGLFLRDTNSNTQVEITGLKEYECFSAQDIHALYDRGNTNRCVSATQANSQSSRSHALLSFNITSRSRKTGATKQSCLTVIDLAGSERAQTTQNRGQRLAEGACINRSLLALGNCINARARKSQFVPYRESKLTRLLRFSLEGRCKTAMVTCISPSLVNFDETHYTLEYAKRASTITGRPTQRSSLSLSKSREQELEKQVLEMSKWRFHCVQSLCKAFPGLESTVNERGGWSTINPDRLVDALQKFALPVSSARIRSISQPPLKEVSCASAANRANIRTPSACTASSILMSPPSGSATTTVQLKPHSKPQSPFSSPRAADRNKGPRSPGQKPFVTSPLKRVRRS